MITLAQRLANLARFAVGVNAETAAAPKNGVRAKVIAVRHVAPDAVGRGFVDPHHRQGAKRLTVTLDDPTFERVRDFAANKRVSFAAAARELIERGCEQEDAPR
jgi:hypothetical protein